VDGGEIVRGEAAGSDPLAVASACVAQLRERGANALLARIHSAVG
jgi:hypothetical protein